MLKRFPLSFHEAQKNKKFLSKISKLVMNGKSKCPILLPEKLERERENAIEWRETHFNVVDAYISVCVDWEIIVV